ncbi:hypothetical protein Q5P01_016601 [Channa striata]|uniref:Uncharacterized protein n=1 Tax=Channa striata TaxID=64152 RepID=A0AA88MAK2_CHASR|nr:hypothetical protein Q5P01_016601 [Channa striata]
MVDPSDSARTFLCATFVFVLTVTTEAGGEEPYGYAPYVWVSVQTCNPRSGWCVGSSATGFALDRGGDGAGSTGRSTDPRCTHYCPGKITATWRGTREHSGDLETHTAGGFLLGAYVRKLDRSPLRRSPRRLRVLGPRGPDVAAQQNIHPAARQSRKQSLLLGGRRVGRVRARPPVRGVQTPQFLQASRVGPPPARRGREDVLAIRNSPYACVLAYAGLGDAESLGACHSQLGDHCFESEGNKFCVGNSRSQWTGLTNADAQASAPLVICEDALTREGVSKMFLGLPRSRELLGEIDFSRLDAFDAFVTPRGFADMSKPGRCQNMWVSGGGASSSDEGVMPYLMTLLRHRVRANRVIFTLSLTGGLKLASIEGGGDETSTVGTIEGELSLADAETNAALRCEEDIDTKCCSGSSSTVWARGVMVNVTVASTSFETLKRFPELIAVAFGVNQFAQGLEEAAGSGRHIHRGGAAEGSEVGEEPRFALENPDELVRLKEIVITVPETQYKDPASGSKSCLDPRYNVGLSNTIVCPGLIAAHGALGIFKEPHREMHSTSYDKIYVANLYKLDSCTPGEPGRRAEVSSEPPQVAININTLVPTTDRKHYMVGILDSERLVEYVPPVNKVCVAHNTGESTHSVNVVSVDDGYAVDKPVVESAHGVIVKPAEALYFVSNFAPSIDYINLNVSCVDYDVSALRPCLIAVCGGDDSCRRDYGRLCNSAHEIVNDARRAGDLMREGLQELATQELKASRDAIPGDGAPFPGLYGPQGASGRRKRFLGAVLGGASLGLAIHVSRRVDALEAQMDATRNSYVSVAGQLVEVSNKLDANVALINGRIDEQERKMKKNTDIANKNFAMLRDAMKRNTEAALRDTNVKFSVMASYQMWYAQIQSVTHQMMPAAMHTKFMARGVENCLRQIASKRSGSYPSGMVVHSVPDGKFYEPSECHGKYCAKPELHERYLRCTKDPSECKTVCGPCHRGICYRDNKVTWMEGSATVEIDSPPLKPFSRPHISDGPVSFADLLKDDLPGAPGLELLEAINTSIKLASVRENLDNITRDLKEFDKRYDEMTAGRVSFGGWLSGFASDAALWTSVAVLTTWCGALSAGIAYLVFCGGGNGGGGGGEVLLPRYVKRPRAKML